MRTYRTTTKQIMIIWQTCSNGGCTLLKINLRTMFGHVGGGLVKSRRKFFKKMSPLGPSSGGLVSPLDSPQEDKCPPRTLLGRGL